MSTFDLQVVSKSHQPDGTILVLIQVPGVVKLLGHVFCQIELTINLDRRCTLRIVTPDGVVQHDEIAGSGHNIPTALNTLAALINQLPNSPTQESWWLPTGEIGYDDTNAFYTYSPSPGILMTMTLPYKVMSVYDPNHITYFDLLFVESEASIYYRPYSSN